MQIRHEGAIAMNTVMLKCFNKVFPKEREKVSKDKDVNHGSVIWDFLIELCFFFPIDLK